MSVPAIKDVMTKNPITVDAGASIMSAAELMREKQIRHVPVVSKGKPISILSSQQVMSIAEMYGSLGPRTSLDCGEIKAYDELFITAPDAALDDVCRTMAERKLSSALVMSGDKIEGIFTLVDACRYIASL